MKNDLEIFLKKFDNLSLNSKQISKNTVFIAYPGNKHDGREFIQEAIENGAAGIIFESKNLKKNLNLSIPNISISDLRNKLAAISSQFYEYPSKKISIIGITGTNGKTTSAYWLSQCLNHLKIKTAFIGTLGYGDLKKLKKSQNTTPSAIDLQRSIKEIYKKKYKYVAMEVSSHGIKEQRINNIEFKQRLFTNLSRDHLDYHKTMSEYAEVKKKFMLSEKNGNIIVNIDDKVGQSIFNNSVLPDNKKVSFSIYKKSKIQAINISQNHNNLNFDLNYYGKSFPVRLKLIGIFNIYNVLGVIGCLSTMGFEVNQIINSLKKIKQVPGRTEFIKKSKDLPSVMIDYAHTADALENILKSIKNNSFKKIILVFGCGGDRDKGKRKEMAKIAEEYADHSLITSDNSRNETFQSIAKDALSGRKESKVKLIENRGAAIIAGISRVQSNGVLYVLGRGHETILEIGSKKTFFNDASFIRKSI